MPAQTKLYFSFRGNGGISEGVREQLHAQDERIFKYGTIKSKLIKFLLVNDRNNKKALIGKFPLDRLSGVDYSQLSISPECPNRDIR